MVEVLIWNPIERMLWGAALSIGLICGMLYIHAAKKREGRDEKILMYGFGCLVICLSFTWIFFCLGDFYINGHFKGDQFYGDYNNHTSLYELFVRIGYIFTSLEFLLFFYAFERVIKAKIYPFTIINTILFIAIVISPFSTAQMFTNVIAAGVNTCFFTYFVLKTTKWAQLEFKAVSAIIFLAFAVMLWVSLLSGAIVKTINVFPIILNPILFIIGALLGIIPLIIDPKYFLEAKKYWIIIGFMLLSLSVIIILILFLWGIILFALMGIFMVILFVFVLFSIIKSVRSPTVLKVEEKKQNLLATFTRSRRATEEEISISKEKKTCLVCKNKVKNFRVFICECGAFYCDTCAHALIGLENQCWACEKALDESVPMNVPEKKEVQITNEDKNVHKKDKPKPEDVKK